MGKTGARLRRRKVGNVFLDSETDCCLDCTMDNIGGGDGETAWLSIVECLTCHTKAAVFKRSHFPPQRPLAISGGSADGHNWGCSWHLGGRGCKRLSFYSVSTGELLLSYVFLDSYLPRSLCILTQSVQSILCKSPSRTIWKEKD